MSRPLKELMTREIATEYADLRDCIVIDYTRVTAVEADQLRAELRKQGAKMQVVKNRLAARAFRESDLSELAAALKGPSAIIYGPDIGSLTKFVSKWAKEHNKVQIRGGIIGRKRLDAGGAKRLAALPPMEALRQQAASLILSPITGIMYAIQAIPTQIAVALGAIRDKKSKGEAEQ